MTRHNELRDEVADLVGKSFTLSYVCEEPLFHLDFAVQEGKVPALGLTSQQSTCGKRYRPIMKEDLLIRKPMGRDGRTVFTTCLSRNTYAHLLHHDKLPQKCLLMEEREKKHKYLEACLRYCRHLSPFIVSVYGLLDVQAEATLKRIDSRITTKWKQPYSRTCGNVKSRVANTQVRANHRCIWDPWVPACKFSVQRPQWVDGDGIHLFR